MYKIVNSICVMFLFFVGAFAQQNVGIQASGVSSPIINDDGSVTFLLDAPKANEVIVIGDWNAEKGGKQMKKNSKGIWSFTTDKLQSEMYTYRYVVDNMTIIDPANPFSRRDVKNLFSYFYINGGSADYYQVHNVAHGAVSENWYYSASLGMNRRLQVYTPAGYNQSNQSYPVLYLLHGSGGDENAWVELGNVVRIMDNLIAEGKAEPMIVVMPNGNPSKEAAPSETYENLSYHPTMSNNLPGFRNGAFESSFPEIISYIDATYKTKSTKNNRAIAGLSMGGFHSWIISANYPDLFDYVGLFSAGFPEFDEKISFYSHVDEKLKIQVQKGYKLYWVGCGIDDQFKIHDKAKDFAEKMKSFGGTSYFHSSPKGHVWANWRQYMLLFVPQLFK